MKTIQLNRAHYPVRTLGPGVRAGLWTQGCSLKCRGCMSPDTWIAEPHHTVAIGHVIEWITGLDPIDGLTISGGEPFDQPESLSALLGGVRLAKPDIDVMVYSGRTLAALLRRKATRDVLTQCDIVITGPYVESRAHTSPWTGSSNQRVIALTPLARRRLADHATATPAQGNLQIGWDGTDLRIVGVPRPGDLAGIGAALGDMAVIGRTSWIQT